MGWVQIIYCTRFYRQSHTSLQWNSHKVQSCFVNCWTGREWPKYDPAMSRSHHLSLLLMTAETSCQERKIGSMFSPLAISKSSEMKEIGGAGWCKRAKTKKMTGRAIEKISWGLAIDAEQRTQMIYEGRWWRRQQGLMEKNVIRGQDCT